MTEQEWEIRQLRERVEELEKMLDVAIDWLVDFHTKYCECSPRPRGTVDKEQCYSCVKEEIEARKRDREALKKEALENQMRKKWERMPSDEKGL